MGKGEGDGNGNGTVGVSEGVEVPPAVGETDGVAEGVAVPVPLGEPVGDGDPLGVGEARMAVKNAACGIVQVRLPLTNLI